MSDPRIEEPRDAIVKVTSCAICGSDLHLYHNLVPAMLPGDIMGHEMMGEVVEVGSDGVTVVCADGRIKLTRVQADGPKVAAGEFAASIKLNPGTRLT